MTTKVILYPNESGTISVMAPCAAVGEGESESDYLTRIAQKDVPTGVAYLIVDRSDLPEDRTDRDRWTADFSTPDGYGG